MNIKWALLALIAFGLLVFGYKAHMDQQTAPSELNRGPIAVAAVRGSFSRKRGCDANRFKCFC